MNDKSKSKKIIFLWFFFYATIAVLGVSVGMNAIIPGPTSKNALLLNTAEKFAIEKGMPPKDGFLILLSQKTTTNSEEQFNLAQKKLIDVLKEVKIKESNLKLFTNIQSSVDNELINSSRFISKNGKDRMIIATGNLPVYDSPKEFLLVPKILANWNKEFPEYSYSYLSNSTGEDEVFKLVNRDLDRSLVYTIPLTIFILVSIFSSFRAALIPIAIAIVSLLGSLGLTAIFSNLAGGISVTASQLIVLLVLAIGVDYSLFFLTRLKEEIKSHQDFDMALAYTKKTTGRAILWSGIIVAISLFGLLLMQDTVLNSMAIVSIFSVVLTLISCNFVLPEIITLWKDKLNLETAKDKKRQNSLITNLSVRYPLISLCVLSSILLYISSFTFKMNLGNTMIPEILPKSLQGMAMFASLEHTFPEISGGDASIIIYGDKLEELDEDGSLEQAIEKLRELGLRGPFKTEISSDFSLIRYKFLINGYGDKIETQNFVTDLKNYKLSEVYKPLGLESSISGVVEHSVSEAKRYKKNMPIVFSAVLSLSFIFLLFVFKSIVIPLKAILLNLISTGTSFGVLVLVFQILPFSPYNYGVIESFIPPLLFTILFGLSMDYHVFMLSRISEEFHKHGDVKKAVITGTHSTSRTINGAALIMISVFFIAATLDLPVMKQLGIGLGTAILIDATLIRSILLPSSMILLGSWNWYLPSFLEKIKKIRADID